MKKIVIAKNENIDDIVDLRVEMQIEDWEKLWGKIFPSMQSSFMKLQKNILKHASISHCILR